MNTIDHTATSRDAGAAGNGAEGGGGERAAGPQLLRLMWGIHVSRCVYAVAELGIADLLADRAPGSEELAVATGSDESSLYRVLRLLAAFGVFEEDERRSFRVTALGQRLRDDAEVSMRSWALLLEALGGVRPFEHILETVRTGRPGFDAAFGTGIFGYLAQHPKRAMMFDAAMSERTAAFAPSVAATHDFSDADTVVDVGGGCGTLLVEVLRRHPHLHGVLLETPTVAAHGDGILDASDIAGRCDVGAGQLASVFGFEVGLLVPIVDREPAGCLWAHRSPIVWRRINGISRACKEARSVGCPRCGSGGDGISPRS